MLFTRYDGRNITMNELIISNMKKFFDGKIFADSLPKVLAKFWVNIQLFLIAEVLILGFGLVLAVLRSLPGPVFFPIRALATAYVDIFRALPGILVIYVLGFGIPILRIPGVPRDPFFWGVVALTLLYSAYVSEVYRAGIDSIHPSQVPAALSVPQARAMYVRPSPPPTGSENSTSTSATRCSSSPGGARSSPLPRTAEHPFHRRPVPRYDGMSCRSE